MSLKRKASFPSIAIPLSPQNAIDQSSMDDSPKHLHSRTRKRLRNDRPDEQAVYDKTLQWIYAAQQRVQQAPTPPTDEDEDMESAPTPAVDHRQQTLLRFFRPASQCSGKTCRSAPANQFPINPSRSIRGFPGYTNASVSPVSPKDCEIGTPTPHLADRNMDVDMDLGADESNKASSAWTGFLRSEQ